MDYDESPTTAIIYKLVKAGLAVKSVGSDFEAVITAHNSTRMVEGGKLYRV